MQTIPQIDATQPRHREHNITITLEQITDTGVYIAKLSTRGVYATGEYVQTVGSTVTGDVERLTAHAIQCADDVLTERGIDLAPPPAAPAKAAKKSKARKTTIDDSCTCPLCRKVAIIADGVYRCRITRDFQIFFDGKRVDFKRTELEAQIVLNTLTSDALKRAA